MFRAKDAAHFLAGMRKARSILWREIASGI
jgi:hypothetical protein